MEIDLSPLKEFTNELFLQLLIYLLIVLCIGLIIVFILKKLRVHKSIASPIAGIATLYAAYKVFILLYG